MTSVDILRAMEGLDEDLVEQAEKTIAFSKGRHHHRWLAVAASVVLAVCLLWAVGFENVSAAIDTVSAVVQKLFLFVPGVGPQQMPTTPDEDWQLCTYVGITEHIEEGGAQAQLVRAYYADGKLSVAVCIENRILNHYSCFRLYRNGQLLELIPGGSLYLAEASTFREMTAELRNITASDCFEVEIEGFDARLSFALLPCETYAQMEQIGPTITHNGISLTVTAHRLGDQLAIWCYESRDDTATTDRLEGIGIGPADNVLTRWLEGEKGIIEENFGGWSYSNRFVFTPSAADTHATLHIPYLAMRRQETVQALFYLPADYGSSPCGMAIPTSLGDIVVTAVERVACSETKDEITVHFAYESEDTMQRLCAFSGTLNGQYGYRISDPASGTIQSICITVPKDVLSLHLSITELYYCLMEEYVFELNF